MPSPSSAFIDLLSGKSPEAIYDALHAGRYLSAVALQSPPRVLELIKTTMLSYRQRPLTPARQLERVSLALADSDYLSECGMQLYRGEGTESL